MKPEKKTYEVEYWSCGKDTKGHFHVKEISARSCMNKRGKTPYADKCEMLLARNKQIIREYIEGMSMAQAGRNVDLSSTGVREVIQRAMKICQSNPGGCFRPTVRTQEGRYTNQDKQEIYITHSLSLDEIRQLVKIWTEAEHKWWIFLDGLSDQWEHRDGPPLYRFTDEEINSMELP